MERITLSEWKTSFNFNRRCWNHKWNRDSCTGVQDLPNNHSNDVHSNVPISSFQYRYLHLAVNACCTNCTLWKPTPGYLFYNARFAINRVTSHETILFVDSCKIPHHGSNKTRLAIRVHEMEYVRITLVIPGIFDRFPVTFRH